MPYDHAQVKKYSPELINEVNRIYSDVEEIKSLAKKGNYFLGRWLDDSSSKEWSATDILKYTTLEELQNEARIMLEKRNLYKMWINETR